MSHTQLILDALSISYDKHPALNSVSFELKVGQIGCLLGPSGCGKTTLLHAIAGFLSPQSGRILLAEQEISSPHMMLDTEKRNVGMVFQDFALFPNRTLIDNIGFALYAVSAKERKRRIDELLSLVNLKEFAQFYPHELSGGQQQRVALARALAQKPNLLLLDEPFSNIDTDNREQLAQDVKDILHEEKITALLVTHDQLEAFAMADMLGVLNQGNLQQWNETQQIYQVPANPFVAHFIGRGMLIAGELIDAHNIQTELGCVSLENSSGYDPKRASSGKIQLLVRPEHIQLDSNSPIQAQLINKTYQGSHFLLTLRLKTGLQVKCMAPNHVPLTANQTLGLRLQLEKPVIFSD